jgi:glycosyltransferase involved in cell wall biosynthesis
MNTHPAISVLLPVYNGSPYLGAAIESILNQNERDFELIIINDGSTDDSGATIQRYRDRRIVLLTNERNLGLVPSLNRGLAVVRGTFIARMDADDLSAPDRFGKQRAVLEAQPAIGVLGTGMRSVGRRGWFGLASRPPAEHELIVWGQFFRTTLFHPTVMLRTGLLVQAGGYSREFPHCEDTELWSRLMTITRLANLPEPLYVRRMHAASVCAHYSATQLAGEPFIRQRIFTTFLKRDVTLEQVRIFYDLLGPHRTSGAGQAAGAVNLLEDLYRAITQNRELPEKVIGPLAADVERKKQYLMSRTNRWGRMRQYGQQVFNRFMEWLWLHG